MEPLKMYAFVLKSNSWKLHSTETQVLARFSNDKVNKKHLKNVGPIHHYEPPHAHSPDVASGTVARRLHIDVHDDDNDNA